MQTFVYDLIDLKTIKDEPLSLEAQVFNPNKIFMLILNVFTPLASGKKIKIVYKSVA